MFYDENTFVLPDALFTGEAGILEMLEGPLYQMSRETLAKLKRVKVCVPVQSTGPDRPIEEKLADYYTLL